IDMQLSLNCLISEQSPDDIFNVLIGEYFTNNENIRANLNNMTVANFKNTLFDQKEIKEAKITKMNI
ncbi:17510_t:CDS:1, partial [Rhizophagus irregularis]